LSHNKPYLALDDQPGVGGLPLHMVLGLALIIIVIMCQVVNEWEQIRISSLFLNTIGYDCWQDNL